MLAVCQTDNSLFHGVHYMWSIMFVQFSVLGCWVGTLEISIIYFTSSSSHSILATHSSVLLVSVSLGGGGGGYNN